MITFSDFKLPHYINIIFPSTAILTAAYLIEAVNKQTLFRRLFTTQLVVCFVCIAAAMFINLWAFPLKNWLVIVVTVLLIVASIIIFRVLQSPFRKIVGLSVLTSVFKSYLLNSNFY